MSDIDVFEPDEEVKQEGPKPAFEVLLDGVMVGFRDMTPMQLTMSNLIVQDAPRRSRKIGEAAAMLEMMGKLLNIIESLVIDEDHRDHLMEACMGGRIDFMEVYTILRRGEPVIGDDEDPEPPKAKAKKSVAARNRVRR